MLPQCQTGTHRCHPCLSYIAKVGFDSTKIIQEFLINKAQLSFIFFFFMVSGTEPGIYCSRPLFIQKRRHKLITNIDIDWLLERIGNRKIQAADSRGCMGSMERIQQCCDLVKNLYKDWSFVTYKQLHGILYRKLVFLNLIYTYRR